MGSRGKAKEVDVRQKLVYLIEVYEGWGGGRGYPEGLIIFEDSISLGQKNQILFLVSHLL